jgi:Cu(I)/Ag(I) efflux system membrane fusion protein
MTRTLLLPAARFALCAVLFCASLILFACRKDEQPVLPDAKASDSPKEHTATSPKYQCPMHPQIVSDAPGDCPICNMKLVPISGQEGPSSAPSPALPGLAPLVISAQHQQLMGIQKAVAQTIEFAGTIRTSGRFTFDETRVHHIHTRYEAYVEHVFADFTGKAVRKGEPLVSLYSPDLLAAEQEYLLAVQSQRSGPVASGKVSFNLVEAARQKLLLWNISASDIAQLERRGKPSRTMNLYAPGSGYVLAKTAVHGMRVKPEDSLFDIVDLSRLWVLADVYEYELPRLRLGQIATITVPYWPERSWAGHITYIYPSVDPQTRTIRVRIEVDNAKAELKAEMLANVTIAVSPRRALVVPDDAVLETGTRKLVFVASSDGRLTPREVKTGDRAERKFEITAGLSEGEQVVLGATFLVDSESRLQAALQAMAAPGTVTQVDGGDTSRGQPSQSGSHAGHGGQ